MLPWTDPLNPLPGEIMRDIIGYLKHHLRTHVHPGLHLLLGVLLTAAFVYNYSTGFKRAVMNAHPGSWVEIPMYLAFYGVPFYGALLLQSRLTRVSLPRDGRFWLVSALALLLLVLNRSALSLSPRLLDDLDLSRTVIWYLNKVLINLVRAVAFIVPLMIARRIWDREQPDLYGFSRRHFTWRPYTLMLLIMAGPIIWASFQPSFMLMYPIYRPGLVETATGWPTPLTYGLHEICYALRFVGVEVFFRGFLVVGLLRWLGRGAILPMVCLYAVWHFGKPMPEALGSVFGGYILGIIAYESRCILGGTAIHMGVALLMNLAALWQVLR